MLSQLFLPHLKKVILECRSEGFFFFSMGTDATGKLDEERDLGAALEVTNSTKAWGIHLREWGTEVLMYFIGFRTIS